jgi:hypothetical protein
VTAHDDALNAALIAAGEEPLRDEAGRFAPRTDAADALQRGGYPALDEAAAALRRGQADGLRRLGVASAPPLETAVSSSPRTAKTPPPDWGGGVRGQPIEYGPGAGMNDVIKALARRDRY